MKFINIILGLYLCFQTILLANRTNETSNYSFEHIGITEGLSQSSILSILQDSRGYMWFGTATGLNRYDGYEFVVYLNDVSDSLSLSDNDISAIFEDKEGNLWIGTAKGVLNKFDPLTETFTHYDVASSSDWYSTPEENYYDYPITFSRNYMSTITSITADSSGNLWIGTWGKGIVRFNPNTEAKKYFYHFRNRANSLSSNKIVSLLFDEENYLWVGTFGKGINRIQINDVDPDSVVVSHFSEDNGYDIGTIITSIFKDYEGDLWFGSYNGEISVLHEERKHLESEAIVFENLSDLFMGMNGKPLKVMSIVEDFKSKIWIGTYGDGLFTYSQNSRKVEHIVSDINILSSLSENEVQSLYIDVSGILWVGTQLGSGINKLEQNENKFSTVPVLGEVGKSLNDKIVWAIHEDFNRNLWFGTYRGGLNKWNKEKNDFSYFKVDENLADDHIRAIISDSSGNLWIGSYSGGLSVYNPNSNNFSNFSSKEGDPTTLMSNQIQSLFLEGDSILWIGTFGGGLSKLNLDVYYNSGKAIFKSYTHNPADLTSISDDRVYKILKKADDIFWVATLGGGLNKFNPLDETFKRYMTNGDRKYRINNNRVMTLEETEDGFLLVGMFGGGLDIFDPKTERFENLNESISLTCSDIYGILPDTDNGFWLSTNNGIYKLDKNLKTFQQYDISDGVQSLEFSGGAYFIGSDSTYYFGGINGVNYFNPEKIRSDSYLPPIVISRIKVFDAPIKGEKKSLVFGIDQNYFSFEFASLDFKNSSKNKYKFIMEGLDEQWSYTDAEDRRVFYTNLDPGDYTFRVQGTNNDGIWSPNEASVDITILAPFWMQWWFISALILFLGGIITFFINQRIRFLVALDKLKTNIAADLHDNIGAGLTEISILSELAVNEINKPVYASKHINLISDISRQLVESMSDIVWVVNPQRDSLYDLIVRLKDSYGELLADLGINLRTSNLEQLKTIKLPMDYRQNLYLILKETINNAMKHSGCNKIDVVTKVIKSKLYISASDNGNGFDLDNVKVGNGLENIKKRSENIGGFLRIKSSKDKGTKIVFEGKLKS